MKVLIMLDNQAWSSNLLSSGSRDRTILHRDVRAKEPFIGKLLGHRSEVCGLKVRGIPEYITYVVDDKYALLLESK